MKFLLLQYMTYTYHKKKTICRTAEICLRSKKRTITEDITVVVLLKKKDILKSATTYEKKKLRMK